MSIHDNDLLKFNAIMLLNKRDVLESFEDFIEHHRQHGNGERYSEGKRKVLLALCDEFLERLYGCSIPTLIKPWYCYEYSVTYDGIRLDLIKYEDVTFNIEGELDSMLSSPEYTLVEVKCDNLTVEQYAQMHNVTDITVRQWIRRGKLRTAKKYGRDWLIPAMSDTPKRGFESVTYRWETIPEEITNAFPFLSDTECVYICQDDFDKKVFYAITGWPNDVKRHKVVLTIKEREQLELMLITSSEVMVDILSDGVRYTPPKREFSFPLLANDMERTDYPFNYIIIKANGTDTLYFDLSDTPGRHFPEGEPEEYILPISWSIWGVPKDDEAAIENVLDGNDFTDCVELGYLTGNLILCGEMVSDGCDPMVLCDDLSADMGCVMFNLSAEGGPLNDETGDPFENILYINELTINETHQRQGLGSRILCELPWLCKRSLHIQPSILAYYVSDFLDETDADRLEAFYQKNGFQKLNNSKVLYAYTEW